MSLASAVLRVHGRTLPGRPSTTLALLALLVLTVPLLGACGAAPADDPATATATAPPRPLSLDAAGLGMLPAVEVMLIPADGGPSTTVVALIADTPATRMRGLQGVAALADGEGMLFLHPDEPDDADRAGFWMLDTPIPLDIVFVRDGRVVGVGTMQPCRMRPCPITHPGEPYDAALEIPAGWLARSGIGVGATIAWSDPAIGADGRG
jgi:uncharacterized membrane protein (UPF0127 family)